MVAIKDHGVLVKGDLEVSERLAGVQSRAKPLRFARWDKRNARVYLTPRSHSQTSSQSQTRFVGIWLLAQFVGILYHLLTLSFTSDFSSISWPNLPSHGASSKVIWRYWKDLLGFGFGCLCIHLLLLNWRDFNSIRYLGRISDLT